ncbi:ABC transporter substrate-binding protein [Bifidobacterium eulemuris]|uniref:ABC transporter, solute-binding protein n=1 Tax=Bifidobacterium eulemuris TaxID=1765219 RepID=A0A261FYK9_9BIFI|nr:extracellular solute-binding protein [Bifidobacterium eulemuris]OZG64261.1 ABC transporter, solute-binding protein [Bifidobacterium eulemuris]QOL32812.1 extracellular solute-binding protein [Bifidobacterium eulemuris]
MKARKVTALVACALVASMLTACGGTSGNEGEENVAFDPEAKTTITLGAWTVSQNPEWQTMVDAFTEEYPNVTIEIKEYSADDYDKQLTADISGHQQPDVMPIKTMATYYTYAIGSGGFADLTDVAQSYDGDENIDLSALEIDGKYYALPYKNDSWVLYYNKDMFEKAGVDAPDGTWTWDDYTEAAKELKEKLPEAGYDADSVYPTYLHSWMATVQSFATAQSDAYDQFFAADFSYMKPYYERALEWQDEGLTIDYNTAFTTKVQYQSQFGTQKAAMMPMGTWYISSLLKSQKSGDSDDFEWGLAPIPQNPDGQTSDMPMTFGDPGSFAVSSEISGQELAAAKEFVKWVAGEDGSKVLASIGISPAYTSQTVVDAFFSAEGMPQDQLSRDAWQKHDRGPENPVGDHTQVIQNLLGTAHSSIMSESQSIDDALAEASQNIKDQGAAEE